MLHSYCCEPERHTPERAACLNVLDSRALGRADCFAQRFMRPGTYAYNVVPGHGHLLTSEHPYVINVGREEAGEMSQHNVLVTQDDKGFTVDQVKLSIRLGDLVLWSGNGRTRSPYAIVGDQDFFNSARMVNECGYSHAFGTPGEYRWVDAYGSKLGGTINVSAPKSTDSKGYARWTKQLQEGGLVMITEKKADPAKLDIVVGQTVFFAVVTSSGISITDERLLELGAGKSR